MPKIQHHSRGQETTVNLFVSLVFHGLIIAGLTFLAAREGLLGKQLKTIAVTMAPKEKPPEPERPKEPEKQQQPPTEPQTRQKESPVVPTPPPVVNQASLDPLTAPPAAPPPVGLPGFSFSDGAKAVESTSDPIALYRGYVEFTLKSRWNRPEGLSDDSFSAEVELSIGSNGEVLGSQWKRGSGHPAWDESVRKAVHATRSLGRSPPKKFPSKFLVRFDVATEVDATQLP